MQYYEANMNHAASRYLYIQKDVHVIVSFKNYKTKHIINHFVLS